MDLSGKAGYLPRALLPSWVLRKHSNSFPRLSLRATLHIDDSPATLDHQYKFPRERGPKKIRSLSDAGVLTDERL